jgi:hypothetical protein
LLIHRLGVVSPADAVRIKTAWDLYVKLQFWLLEP